MEEKRVENNKRLFKGMSLEELMEIAISTTTHKSLKEEIKMFICENFEHTTEFKFLQAIKKIEESNYREEVKAHVINVKICARDIIQALDFEHIGYLPEMKKIILQKIEAAKIMS